MTTLSKNIIATIAYYDIFDYPMTSFEIWKYLVRDTVFSSDDEVERVSLGDVVRELESDTVRRAIGNDSGLYFLHGKQTLVKRRLERGKTAIGKLKGVARLAKLLRFFPFVRMVALTGSLAMKNSKASGDWDLFVVMRSGHIWTGRAFFTSVLHMLGIRRHGKKVRDRACLNYWVTTDSREIVTKDLFSSNEYFFIVPLFNFVEFQKFQESNQWIDRFRVQYRVNQLPHLLCVEDFWLSRLVRDIFEIILSDPWLETKLATLQKKKIEANPKTKLFGSFIEATDKALIFLPKPQGPIVFEKFKKRMGELSV